MCLLIAITTLLPVLLTCKAAAAGLPGLKGTTIRVGSDYTVAAGSEHTGSILVFGGNILVEGQLEGGAIAVGGKVQVSGAVAGDVVALGGRVILLEGSSLVGSVMAIGGGVEHDKNVELRGPVNSISLAQGLRLPQFDPYPLQLRSFSGYSLYLLGLYLSVLIVGYLFPKQAGEVDQALSTHPCRSILVGTVCLALIVPLTVVMAATVVGLPLVLIIWLVFLIAKLLGYVGVVRATGRELIERVGLHVGIPVHLAIGVVVLGLVRAIPFLGLLSGILVFVAGLGAAFISRLGLGGPWISLPVKRVGNSR